MSPTIIEGSVREPDPVKVSCPRCSRMSTVSDIEDQRWCAGDPLTNRSHQPRRMVFIPQSTGADLSGAGQVHVITDLP